MANNMTNTDVSKKLRLLADLLEIGGEPVFRVIAYRKAAESIEALPESVWTVSQRGELQSIPGVGKGIADHLRELADTGTMASLEAVTQRIPESVAELLAVPDIGPKRARSLYEQAGIDSLEALRA